MAHSPWVESNGGPLLLLPEKLLSLWSGTEVPTDRHVEAVFRWHGGGPASDYDRACDVNEYVGILTVGAGWGLVIGDEPLPTCWISTDWGGLLARSVYAEDDGAADGALESFPLELPWERRGEFSAVSSPLRLFDSADPGGDLLMPSTLVDLQPGSYDVAWARYEPNAETAFTFIRLSRQRRMLRK